MQAITHVEHNIPTVMERYNQLESSIEQRLKWAGGANPALNNVVEQFHEVVNERKALLVVSRLLFRESGKRSRKIFIKQILQKY